MPPRKKGYYTKLDPEVREGLRRYKVEVGVPEAEQIDRALRAWLVERGILKRARRAGENKRRGTKS